MGQSGGKRRKLEAVNTPVLKRNSRNVPRGKSRAAGGILVQKHGQKLQRAAFLVSIEEQWSVDSEQWTENNQGSGILTTVH